MAKNEIKMKLLSVKEKSFSMNPPENIQKADIKDLFCSFLGRNIKTDSNTNLLSLDFGVRYKFKDEVILESVCSFTFSVERLGEFVSQDTIRDIMPHVLSVTIGTLRGVITVRTAGSALAGFPIPMIDPGSLNESLFGKKK